jgi:hypothetical protein
MAISDKEMRVARPAIMGCPASGEEQSSHLWCQHAREEDIRAMAEKFCSHLGVELHGSRKKIWSASI